jgi:PadR family transcriptional regulator PadR
MDSMTDLDAQRRKFEKELATGTVALVLLAILGRDGEPMYGYQIAKQFERADEAALAGKQSALYPVLRNLAAAGLLESWIEPSDAGPPRRYYRITDHGRLALGQWAERWRATRRLVDRVLEGE